MGDRGYSQRIHNIAGHYLGNPSAVLSSSSTVEAIRHHLGEIARIRGELTVLSEEIAGAKQKWRKTVSGQFRLAHTTRRLASAGSILPRGFGGIADNLVKQAKQEQINTVLVPLNDAEALITTVKGQLHDLAAKLRARRETLTESARRARPSSRPTKTTQQMTNEETGNMDRSPDLIRETILRRMFRHEQTDRASYLSEATIASDVGLAPGDTEYYLRDLADRGLIRLLETMGGSSARLTTRGQRQVREGTSGTSRLGMPIQPPGPIINATYATIQNVATTINGNSSMQVASAPDMNADLRRLFEQLHSVIATSGIEGDNLADANQDVQLLEAECKRTQPRLERVKQYVDGVGGMVRSAAPIAIQIFELIRMAKGQ